MQTSTSAINTHTRSNHQQKDLQMTTSSIPKTSGIYKILCATNKKCYIGSTVNLFMRWNSHCNELRRNRHANQHLQRAWNNYGEIAFTFEVIEECSTDTLLEREQYWLEKIKPYDHSIGFNIALHADSPMRGRKVKPHSIETRTKISNSHKGMKASPEARIRMSLFQKRKNVSEETRAKQSVAHKGRKRSPEEITKSVAANTGQKRTPETCANISKSLKGRKCSPEAIAKSAAARTGLKRSVEANIKTGISNSKRYILTTPNGEKLEILNLSKFCRENNLTQRSLSGVACGHRKHYKGWKVERVK